MNVSKYDIVLPFSFGSSHGQCPVLKIKQNVLAINEKSGKLWKRHPSV